MEISPIFNILIADDKPDVVRAFSSTIKKLGHNAIECSTLSHARKRILKESESIDIAFIDNHFEGEGYGVDYIARFAEARPDMQIVLTTKYSLKPELVKQVVDLRVGFCAKDVADPIRLELEIAQQINIKIQSIEVTRRNLDWIRENSNRNREGVFRLFDLFKKKSDASNLKVGKIVKSRSRIIYPRFEKILTVQANSQVKISSQFELKRAAGLVATTELGFGINAKETSSFLVSKIGIDVMAKLKAKVSGNLEESIRGSLSTETLLFVSEEEYLSGIRRREYYRGIEHELYRVEISSACEKCKCGISADVNILVPYSVVEVSCAFDMEGKPSADDGRNGYEIYSV
jgi:CheY-like chemotaxis protein